MTEQLTVIIVDDDLGIREALDRLLRSVGLQVNASASVPEFVKDGRPEVPACLILDIRLPGRSGLDFQRELSAATSTFRSSSLLDTAMSRCPSTQ
jgi:FixJ family two-component response regulator